MFYSLKNLKTRTYAPAAASSSSFSSVLFVLIRYTAQLQCSIKSIWEKAIVHHIQTYLAWRVLIELCLVALSAVRHSRQTFLESNDAIRVSSE